MEYTPVLPQAPKSAPATYELKQDVTGQEPVKRGPQVLKDRNGTEVTLPYPPKKDCKKCYGRGSVGINTVNGRLVICRKCYPVI